MKYIFQTNGERGIKENITVFIENDNMWWSENVGNTLNVIDYIIEKCPDDAIIKFDNLTDNKVNEIIKAITRYKRIISVDGVSKISISKKVRGLR